MTGSGTGDGPSPCLPKQTCNIKKTIMKNNVLFDLAPLEYLTCILYVQAQYFYKM